MHRHNHTACGLALQNITELLRYREVFVRRKYEGAIYVAVLMWRRDYVRTTSIPKRIAKRKAELESEGYQVCLCPCLPVHECKRSLPLA